MSIITKSISMPAISMDHAQLVAVIDQTRAVIPESAMRDPLYEYLELSHGNTTIRFDKLPVTIEDLASAPPICDNVSYRFSEHRGSRLAIDISLRDYGRKAEFSGTEHRAVNTLVAVFQHATQGFTKRFGGELLCRTVKAAAWCACQGLVVYIITTIPWKDIRPIHLAVWVVSIICSMLIPFIPLSKIFPNVLIYKSGATFAQKHAAAISLWGLVISLATAVVPILAWLLVVAG